MPESEVILRLVVAFAAGAAVGFEREYLSKAAGFRTLILISVGSCLFTIISILLTNQTPDRIASNIVTGIGFVGAGVIFREDNRVKGLTTAATIWVTAALGMAAGGGYFLFCATGVGISLFALFLLVKFEDLIEKVNQSRHYKIGCSYKHETLSKYEDMFRAHHLKFKRNKQSKNGENISGTWIVNGSEKNHNAFIKEILKDESVIEFEF